MNEDLRSSVQELSTIGIPAKKKADEMSLTCPYSIAGCSQKFDSVEMINEHMKCFTNRHEWLKNNFTLYLKNTENLLTKREKQLENKDKEINNLQSQLNKTKRKEQILKQQLTKEQKTTLALEILLKEKNEEIISIKHQQTTPTVYSEYIPPAITQATTKQKMFKMTEFSKCFNNASTKCNKWTSDYFYTHTNGYKMCFDVSCPIDSIQIGLYVVPGSNDDSLPWPIRGTVTLSILNNISDTDHYRYVFVYDSDTPSAVSDRVNNNTSARSQKCVSMSTPLMIANLSDESGNKQYLVENTLTFEVSSIEVDINYV